jgi:hypothetical protein
LGDFLGDFSATFRVTFWATFWATFRRLFGWLFGRLFETVESREGAKFFRRKFLWPNMSKELTKKLMEVETKRNFERKMTKSGKEKNIGWRQKNAISCEGLFSDFMYAKNMTLNKSLLRLDSPWYGCFGKPAFIRELGSMLWSQFSAIFDNFRRKKWRFFKKQCYDQKFA